MLRKSACTKTAVTRYSWSIILAAITLTFIWFIGPASTASEVRPPTRSTPDVALVPLVSISGRVLAENCRGIQNARVNLTDSNQNVQTVTTSTFGYFRVDGVTSPGSYTVTVVSIRSQFLARQISVTADMANLDLVAGSSIGLCVNAGPDRPVVLPGGVQLNGVAVSSNSVSTLWSKVSGPGNVNFDNPQNPAAAATFSVQGLYILRFSADDGSVSAFDDVQVTVDPANVPPPPDPVAIAPPLTRTVTTNIATSTKFLYTGPNPIQTGVDPDDIAPERVGLLRGKVVDRAGTPLVNVLISILDHPEFGQTRSRADGMFDMVVNAGGELTVKYEKANFISVQREEKINWQTYSQSDDVVMIPLDPNVTEVNLALSTPVQVASGSMSSDSSGQRRSRLFFKQGTHATIHLPNGATQPISLMHVRSTEFTIGENGPNAMPAALPSTSEYTYAAEYTVDEAIALNATSVSFSQPVIQYLENFIGFPVGSAVPTGSYDREISEWKPEPSGKVVKILSVSAGSANLDVIGNGQPATDQQYADLGINLAERQKLAELYAVDQTLWRVPVDHFTPWDCNYPPANKPPPDVPAPFVNKKPDCDCLNDSSTKTTKKIQSQTVTETIEISRTSYEISLQTGLQRDYQAPLGALVPLVGPTPPDSDVENVGAIITVAGKTFRSDLMAPTPGLSLSFNWDGKDYAGRRVQGPQKATVAVVHLHTLGYVQAPEFGQTGNGSGPTFVRTGAGSAIRTFEIDFGNFDQAEMGLGGWGLNVHHVYSPVTQTLYEGNGRQRAARSASSVVNTTSGDGTSGFGGDGGPATAARLFEPSDVAFAGDGTYYVADRLNSRIRKVAPNGTISTFAGDGSESCPPTAPCGDGGPASSAQLNDPEGVAVAPDGTVYIADTIRHRIRKVDPDGTISTVVGNGSDCQPPDTCGDGGPATAASLNQPRYVHLARDGSLYIGDSLSHRVRKVSTNGNITTVAGSGNLNCPSDNVPALAACIEKPTGVALSENGDLYITGNGQGGARVFRLDTNGRLHVLASGDTCSKAAPNERPQGIAPALCDPRGITIGADGDPYFAADNRIYKIDNDRDLIPFIGTLDNQYNGEGQPVTSAGFSLPAAVAFAPDGSIYVAAANDHRIRKVTPAFPGYTGDAVLIPSEDGTEVFEFNADGRHLRTLNSLTGTNKYAFAYNASGELTAVTDGDNNVTTIERDGNGKPTGIRSPYDQLTTFTRDANGYINSITNPGGETRHYTFSSGGLLLSIRDPLDHVETFTYDALGRLIRSDGPAGDTQIFTRTGTERDHTITHRSGLNRFSVYRVENLDNNDAKFSFTYPDGGTAQELISSDGSTAYSEPNGMTSRNDVGPDPRWGMQSAIPVSSSMTTPAGLIFSTAYSRQATLASPSDPLSIVSLTDTLAFGGATYSNLFTAADRTHVQRTPLNRQTVRTIDSQERVTSWKFANFATSHYGYDTRGRLESLVSGSAPESRSITYGYNSAGGLASVTNALGRTRTFSYNAAERLSRQTLADSRFVQYGYDPEGSVNSITPPGRTAHTFTFDSRDLLASYTAPTVGGNSTTLFDYDLDGDLTRITRPDGQTVVFGYNASGNRSTLTIPTGVYSYSYSPVTREISSITSPGNITMAFERDGSLTTRTAWSGAVSGSVGFVYDANFRPVSQSINGANTVSYDYDADGLITSAGAYSAARDGQSGIVNSATVNSVVDSFSYNQFGDLTSHASRFNGNLIFEEVLTPNKLGSVIQLIETIGGTTTTRTFGYDTTERLRSVTLNGAPQPSTTYSYDDNNNRIAVNSAGNITIATFDAQDRMNQNGGITYTYTAAGELATRTVAGTTTQYSYDAIGNLRGVTFPGTTIEYLIDGANRRVGKRINGSLSRTYLYADSLRMVAELDASGNVLNRFVYGARPNVPEYMVRAGETYRLVSDFRGSVRLVVNSVTGSIAQRIDYDEFGQVMQDTNPGFQPFGFSGGTYDHQTGLVRFGARDYDPQAGRWTAKDPTLFAGSFGNLYEYGESDPVNMIDLNGLGPISVGPGTSGVGNSRNGLIGDTLRSLHRNNMQAGNLSGNLREQADSLIKRIIKERKRMAWIRSRLKVLRERALRCIKEKKKIPDQLLKEVLELRRELTVLKQDELEARIEYNSIIAQTAGNILVEPAADSIDTFFSYIDPNYWIYEGYKGLTGQK